MLNLVGLWALKSVCLYMPEPRAIKLFESVCEAEGVATFSATTPDEFELAARNHQFAAIVTVADCIDEIRLVSNLPIIDIQPLIDDWLAAGSFQKLVGIENLTFLHGTCFIARRR
ncbi:hypothetical protein RRU01S_27_00740 [Agrobacterium rubi TR3 = NBRC 13261]|uniref:Uncharacterized protein n=1 Tax=Agrobacterium rubi TR3 = NBRC 13261 TaxID=1368415 RepID=A0A081D190_9HYPH|nr:hypothetical protein [Agrobacterium rubi]MBP1880514.1 hypothetical protein [Agrobacterium rubi]GAK72686.1 hypothetical protein RRU01S_27_00740 [Agrobacterium rubi TR3 = NBRC 13261]